MDPLEQSILDSSAQDGYYKQRELNRKNKSLGLVGMIAAIASGILVWFTGAFYSLGGLYVATVPLVIGLGGFILSLIALINSGRLRMSNGFGLSGVIVGPIAMVIGGFMYFMIYQLDKIVSDL